MTFVRGLTNSLKLMNRRHLTACLKSSIMRIQENHIVSATKIVIETYISAKLYYNYHNRIIKNTTIRAHYATETISKLTVTSMNYEKTGFH